ncbi:hypothetical protein MMC2321_01133 [Chitinophaga sp. MM2321]
MMQENDKLSNFNILLPFVGTYVALKSVKKYTSAAAGTDIKSRETGYIDSIMTSPMIKR